MFCRRDVGDGCRQGVAVRFCRLSGGGGSGWCVLMGDSPTGCWGRLPMVF